MDWIKCKVDHILSDEFTDSEIGALYRYQAKIAFHERMLTEKEKKSILSDKKERTLSKKLATIFEKSLEKVARKVLEDVEKTNKKKQKDIEKTSKYRKKVSLEGEKCYGNTPVTGYRDVTVQIREDNIREEKEEKKYIKKDFNNSEKKEIPVIEISEPGPQKDLALMQGREFADRVFSSIYDKAWVTEKRGNRGEARNAFDSIWQNIDPSQIESDLKKFVVACEVYGQQLNDSKYCKNFDNFCCQWQNYLSEDGKPITDERIDEIYRQIMSKLEEFKV